MQKLWLWRGNSRLRVEVSTYYLREFNPEWKIRRGPLRSETSKGNDACHIGILLNQILRAKTIRNLWPILLILDTLTFVVKGTLCPSHMTRTQYMSKKTYFLIWQAVYKLQEQQEITYLSYVCSCKEKLILVILQAYCKITNIGIFIYGQSK